MAPLFPSTSLLYARCFEHQEILARAWEMVAVWSVSKGKRNSGASAHTSCQCTVFKDTFELERGAVTDGVEGLVIETGASDDDLRHLVDLLHGGNGWCNLDAKAYFSLIELCDKWGFDALVERVVLRLFRHAPFDPWRTFCIAAKYDVPQLAKAAIAEFGRNPKTSRLKLATFPTDMGREVPTKYLLALVRAIARNMPVPLGRVGRDWDWENEIESGWERVSYVYNVEEGAK